jgi:hypothetical protein
LILALLVAVPAAFGSGCEGLYALSLPTTTINKVEAVGAGAFTLPNLNPGQQKAFRQ